MSSELGGEDMAAGPVGGGRGGSSKAGGTGLGVSAGEFWEESMGARRKPRMEPPIAANDDNAPVLFLQRVLKQAQE